MRGKSGLTYIIYSRRQQLLSYRYRIDNKNNRIKTTTFFYQCVLNNNSPCTFDFHALRQSVGFRYYTSISNRIKSTGCA